MVVEGGAQVVEATTARGGENQRKIKVVLKMVVPVMVPPVVCGGAVLRMMCGGRSTS